MILISEAASIDIKAAYTYLNAESADAAQRLLESIDFAFSIIIEFPNIGHTRPDLTDLDVRFYRVNKYLLIYRGKSLTHIEIVRFLHGYQDLISVL